MCVYYAQKEKFTVSSVKDVVGATMPSINTKLLGEVEITYPHISVQRKIVKILSAIDNIIELNKKVNHNLEQQMASFW